MTDARAFYDRYLAVVNAHRFGDLRLLVSGDVHVNGTLRGVDRYVADLEALVAAFADYRWELRHLLVEGDWLAARLGAGGTNTGPCLGLPATGRWIETVELAHYRLAGGRIAEVWTTVDNLDVRRQLGG